MQHLLDLIDHVLETDADREAFVQPMSDGSTRRMTFGEWAAHADGFADRLAADGVAKGDVVGINMASGIDYAIAYQATIRLGAIATGLNPRLGQAEVAHINTISNPVTTVSSLGEYSPGDAGRRRTSHCGTDPVCIVWTGGTTGFPKGAWFDHRCLQAMTQGAAPLSQFGDRRLSPLPFAHVGYMTRMWDELHHRITTLIVPSPWTPSAALDLIEREQATVCQGVPTQYRLMLDHASFCDTDMSSLRLAGIGASRIPPELVKEMRDCMKVPVVVRYASTESCVATGTRLNDPDEIICGTVGRPNGGVELRITDDNETPTTTGTIGSVQLRSRAAMRGYWKNTAGTTDAITSEGWIRTGDLGSVDADGNLRLVGRSTDMYIRGGYNVYPLEVENCLGAHPAIASAAIVGAPVQDRLGEIGVLFAVCRPGAVVRLDEIRSFVKARLADYKAPDLLVIVRELPTTPIGKVDKKPLRVRAASEAFSWSRDAL